MYEQYLSLILGHDIFDFHACVVIPVMKILNSEFLFLCIRERSVNVSEPESLELTVSNLKPEESYSFRVIAYNDVGPGESSAPLRITTKPDRKTHSHKNTFIIFCQLTAKRLEGFKILSHFTATLA